MAWRHCILAILSLLSQSVVLIITLDPAIGISYRYHKFNLINLSIAAPNLWNALPGHIRNAESIDSFKKQLKTFFKLAYF